MQSSVGQQNIQQQYQPQYQTAPIQHAVQQYPSQGQNVQVPNYSGVNIQIFNPSVAAPGAATPVYNVNAPNYSQNPGCYPAGYYTGQWGQGAAGSSSSGVTGGTAGSSTATDASNTNTTTNKNTEKREIVQLTDEYIKNLENYLNSQDKEIRMMGAKEVLARLEEDNSRRGDKALNALIDKMLQDPYTPIRALALGAIESRAASGDDYTVQILQNMRNSKSGYGLDALSANNALLKMSAPTVEKEFEVKKSGSKTETKTESKTKG